MAFSLAVGMVVVSRVAVAYMAADTAAFSTAAVVASTAADIAAFSTAVVVTGIAAGD